MNVYFIIARYFQHDISMEVNGRHAEGKPRYLWLLINRQVWSQNQSSLLPYYTWIALNMCYHLNPKSSIITHIQKHLHWYGDHRNSIKTYMKIIANEF